MDNKQKREHFLRWHNNYLTIEAYNDIETPELTTQQTADLLAEGRVLHEQYVQDCKLTKRFDDLIIEAVDDLIINALDGE